MMSSIPLSADDAFSGSLVVELAVRFLFLGLFTPSATGDGQAKSTRSLLDELIEGPSPKKSNASFIVGS
jgi:hypothetical protein